MTVMGNAIWRHRWRMWRKLNWDLLGPTGRLRRSTYWTCKWSPPWRHWHCGLCLRKPIVPTTSLVEQAGILIFNCEYLSICVYMYIIYIYRLSNDVHGISIWYPRTVWTFHTVDFQENCFLTSYVQEIHRPLVPRSALVPWHFSSHKAYLLAW
jgi:hypothetical protein